MTPPSYSTMPLHGQVYVYTDDVNTWLWDGYQIWKTNNEGRMSRAEIDWPDLLDLTKKGKLKKTKVDTKINLPWRSKIATDLSKDDFVQLEKSGFLVAEISRHGDKITVFGQEIGGERRGTVTFHAKDEVEVV